MGWLLIFNSGQRGYLPDSVKWGVVASMFGDGDRGVCESVAANEREDGAMHISRTGRVQDDKSKMSH